MLAIRSIMLRMDDIHLCRVSNRKFIYLHRMVSTGLGELLEPEAEFGEKRYVEFVLNDIWKVSINPQLYPNH